MNGLYDGFEGYRTSTSDEIVSAIQHGLVSLDANMLLNLYRYNSGTINDLLNVLEALGDRLFVSHQAMREFWRNRVSVIGNPNGAAQQARESVGKARRSLETTINTWAKNVALDDSERDALHAAVNELHDQICKALDGGQPNRARSNSSDDPILRRLESPLRHKVSPQLERMATGSCGGSSASCGA